jgi:hypothetical protein
MEFSQILKAPNSEPFCFSKGPHNCTIKDFASPSIAKSNIDKFDLQMLTTKTKTFNLDTTDTHMKRSNGENL